MKRFVVGVVAVGYALTLMVGGVYAKEAKSNTVVFAGLPPVWLSISNKRKVMVTVSDQVSDGCWTSVNATKTAVELEMKRSGFKLSSDGGLGTISIFLTALGFEKAGICVVSQKMEVWITIVNKWTSNGHEVVALVNTQIWRRNGISTGGKGIVSNGLKDGFVGYAQQFLVDIDKRKEIMVEQIRKNATNKAAKAYWTNYKID